MNERDSEIMAQSLAGYGYVEGMEMTGSDLVILNTCSIRAKAEQKVMSLLGYLRKIKGSRPPDVLPSRKAGVFFNECPMSI